jgi:ribosomal protein L11 methyltransferase
LERDGQRFDNIADVGTGTGLLAFAALALWPDARAIATDIDPISIDVSLDNARINQVPIGHAPGELLLAVADGMEHEMLVARAPFDLLIANILAGPLIELAPAFAASLAPRAVVVLAGLLDSQAAGVIAAYQAQGLDLVEQGAGEWSVLVLRARAD